MTQPILTPAQSDADYVVARGLIEEYARALGVDLCFQDFDEELAQLRTIYGPPGGCLLLAQISGDTVGCVGVRAKGDGVCELKRLYVRDSARGTGLGRTLSLAAIEYARRLGYSRMRLDTLPQMSAARGLYSALGFHEIDPYYENPIAGTLYMEIDLIR